MEFSGFRQNHYIDVYYWRIGSWKTASYIWQSCELYILYAASGAIYICRLVLEPSESNQTWIYIELNLRSREVECLLIEHWKLSLNNCNGLATVTARAWYRTLINDGVKRKNVQDTDQ